MGEGFLVYGRFRFFKVAAVLCLAAVALYVAHEPLDEPNGGTWLGYGLGGIGAALIVWLMWLGMRKRRYGGRFKLEAWLSAHVYLGLSLVVVVTLHTGLQFGWNLHTLAYALMMIVIVSGIFGIYAYARYPSLMTENRRGLPRAELLSQIAELDRECREIAGKLSDELAGMVLSAVSGTRIGGGMMRQLSGGDPRCATTITFNRLRDMAGGIDPSLSREVRTLLTLLGKKVNLLRTVRRDVQIKALMEIWLYVHVPLSFALLAALSGHILSVFYYW